MQKPCPNIAEAIDQSLKSGVRNGYAASTGYPDARGAVAKHISKNKNIGSTHFDNTMILVIEI